MPPPSLGPAILYTLSMAVAMVAWVCYASWSMQSLLRLLGVLLPALLGIVFIWLAAYGVGPVVCGSLALVMPTMLMVFVGGALLVMAIVFGLSSASPSVTVVVLCSCVAFGASVWLMSTTTRPMP